MTSPADPESPRTARPRPRFLLRDAADINRVIAHLVAHRVVPKIEVRVDRLSSVDSQRAQDRFVRLSEACNCLLGETLGGATLLVGGYATWVFARGWPGLALVVVAALGAALIGKGIELASTRVRMLLVLRALRHRLAESIAGRIAEMPAKVAEPKVYRHALNREVGNVLPQDRLQRSNSTAVSARPRILVCDVGDINRLVVHLFTHWTLPHAGIQVDVLPKLTVQRAQDRLVRLSAGYSFVPAAVLAMASFLGGLVYVVWPTDQVVLWTMHQDWTDVLWVLMATLCAALIGCAGEMIWIRLRLLWVLQGLRRRIGGG